MTKRSVDDEEAIYFDDGVNIEEEKKKELNL
jgi:hypothetical protein